MSWETVIGLEVHVQLATATKIFCGCSTAFGDPPNTNVCPVCLGLPGALPVTNDRAIELALATALALGCEVPSTSVFARKNYFYPDLPKGYQISQYDRPLGVGGRVPVEIDGDRRAVALTRVHLEEDAGKSLHSGTPGGESRIDLNRCGTPLLEIVTEPDLRRPEEAGAFLESLRRIVRALEVSDGDMSRGSLRCDANVSVRPAGAAELGTKTELKNLNRIKAVERAIAAEAARQVAALEAGGAIEPATLLWDEDAGVARPMRTKEDAPDYRYFPEPDLPPIVIDAERRARVEAARPELPFARRDRFVAELGLPAYDASVLTESRPLAEWFEAVAVATGDAKLASNWTMGEALRTAKESGGEIPPVEPARAAELLRMIADGTVSGSAAKTVWARLVETGESAPAIVASEGLAQIRDEGRLEALVDEVIAGNPEPVAQLVAGNEKVLGFLVGRVMAASGGKADPKRVSELFRERLG